jgi:catechol 2,3-dioxygenase-like lactoylglutathione lyase family enzyme
MPSIEAVLETSLYVSDLARSVRFYRDVLGLHLMSEFDDERGAAFAVGPSVLLLFRAEETRKQRTIPTHGSNGRGHVAFRIRPEELATWRNHLESRGIPIELEHSFEGNPPSLFFRDPDGNLLEIAVASIWPWPAHA